MQKCCEIKIKKNKSKYIHTQNAKIIYDFILFSLF